MGYNQNGDNEWGTIWMKEDMERSENYKDKMDR